MKKLVVYDLDGTLVDTRDDIARAANHLRNWYQLPSLSTSEIAAFVGRGLHQLVRDCLGVSDSKVIEKGAKIYREYYSAHMMDSSRLYEGARAVLDYFSRRNRVQAVITNKPNPFSREILKALGVESYFVEIVAGDEAYPKKPAPAALKALMEKAGASREETIMIGDSPIDIQTARNAQVEAAVIAHGFSTLEEIQKSGPDWISEDFYSLLEIAKRQNW